MTPGDMRDWYEFARDYGPWAIFLFCLGLAILGLAFRTLLGWFKHISQLVANLEQHTKRFEKAWTTPNGQIVSHASHMEDAKAAIADMREMTAHVNGVFMKHVEDTERAASDEHWRSCPLDKCPHLQRFYAQLEDVEDKVDKFSSDAQASRERTQEAINIFMRRLDDLFVRQISALRQMSPENGQ